MTRFVFRIPKLYLLFENLLLHALPAHRRTTFEHSLSASALSSMDHRLERKHYLLCDLSGGITAISFLAGTVYQQESFLVEGFSIVKDAHKITDRCVGSPE
ncbi:hypothetical protein GY45DRAFT_1126953 [Cubamyces sp. BRFM 1775]|nr:hypothetical protein GY45DRAFT_1126953 [Cubamyces sp. BRFM 1775]